MYIVHENRISVLRLLVEIKALAMPLWKDCVKNMMELSTWLLGMLDEEKLLYQSWKRY
jgi:hypothetical protein